MLFQFSYIDLESGFRLVTFVMRVCFPCYLFPLSETVYIISKTFFGK